MAQNSDVATPIRRWTRADFTALRAHLNRLPIERIANLYYTEDDLLDLGIETPGDLRIHIEALRDILIQRASVANPHLAEMLRNARQTALWSSKLVGHLVQAAESDSTTPRKSDAVSVWLKPRVAAALHQDGIRILADLITTIETRGTGWWKPIPRIGTGKAEAILAWLEKQQASLGRLQMPQTLAVAAVDLVEISPERREMVPLERVALPFPLSGADGANRNAAFPLISARNDLQAVEAYLYKFRAQEKTRRAYQKELERFLLWCIYERRKPMSSALLDDCEAYKDFLAAIPAHWTGRKVLRMCPNWRPFVGQLSAKSQRYAVQAIRTFFEWLTRVRYLRGNPWIAVSDPPVAAELAPMQIDKALSPELWELLVSNLDKLCSEPDEALWERYKLRGAASHISIATQFRLARAALLLMGDAGLRREEVAGAQRSNLRPSPDSNSVWELNVLGKRKKWRTVFPTVRCVEAIRAHWDDRGEEFDFGMATIPLLSPVAQLQTGLFQSKHGVVQVGQTSGKGFSPDGIYQLVKTALLRIANDEQLEFSPAEREILKDRACHAFRHTFGVTAVEGEVPLDVLQGVFGHASIQTTTIYIQAPKKRAARELGKFFGRK